MGWIEIAKAEEVSIGLHLKTMGSTRIVLSNSNGALTAFNARCPHSGGPLEYSEAEGSQIICPLHGWRFDLESGGCETHGYRPLHMYELSVRNGAIFINLPESGSAAPASSMVQSE